MTLRLTKSNILHKTYKALSIQISLNGLSFCIHNTLANTIEELRSFDFSKQNSNNPELLLNEVKQIIEATEILQQDFDSLKVIYVNHLSAFVPNAVFDEEHLAEYLKYNIKILTTDFITYDKIESSELVNVYIPFVNVNNFFLDWFGQFDYEHFATILVSKLVNLSKNTDKENVYIHLTGKDEFQIIVIKQKKLIFYNNFKYQSKEDFIYYLLFVYEQLELNPELIPTTFIAAVDKEHPLFNIAYTYIRNVAIYKEKPLFEKYLNMSANEILNNFALINILQ
ncbi:DUF3822 family protein [Neptunitalea lumnitzerae]|nr:DUF3822 family protein [Neptunitalea sp. Y10]